MSEDRARNSQWDHGYVHVYTGHGKGKTCAALGLTLRAAGAGLPVFVAQFAKGRPSSERAALARFHPLIAIRNYGRPDFILDAPSPEDLAAAAQGLDEVRRVLANGHYRVVILDEAATAVTLGLFSVESLLDLIDSRPANVELVITGRDAHPLLIARADLVTEMRAIKHYYAAGVPARAGIEY